jgi:succinylarginine dihydrolase
VTAVLHELNFDGLVGPTHHHAGLSHGNLASTGSHGRISNPRAAALQGLAKMRFVRGLGVKQAVLPPQPRPDFDALRRLGFHGSDAEMLECARRTAPRLLSAVASASSMWAANAATVAPACDAGDGKLHVTPANLVSLLHRSLEARYTHTVLSRIFADERYFVVHEPLPATELCSDEGAANHTRLGTSGRALHLFGFGRGTSTAPRPERFPARQAREASAAVARLHRLAEDAVLLVPQAPAGIDAGAFHSDVLAVGNGAVLLLHEHAFSDLASLLEKLKQRLGPELVVVVASDAELPVADAVSSYPFNSQLVTLPNGEMALIAPRESEALPSARRYLERVVAETNPVSAVHYVDVNASMLNGGGPACLRLRVPLTDVEIAALGGDVLLDDELLDRLTQVVERRYRDRLVLDDLADPSLAVEAATALDEITALLGLSSVYDFQRSP